MLQICMNVPWDHRMCTDSLQHFCNFVVKVINKYLIFQSLTMFRNPQEGAKFYTWFSPIRNVVSKFQNFRNYLRVTSLLTGPLCVLAVDTFKDFAEPEIEYAPFLCRTVSFRKTWKESINPFMTSLNSSVKFHNFIALNNLGISKFKLCVPT